MPPLSDRFALARAPLRDQLAALDAIIRADPDLLPLIRLIRDEGLPDGWLWAGCLYQTVWNVLTGKPHRYGIKDYDIAYYDAADISYEAEDAVIRRFDVASAPLGLKVEVRNQARVHLWFEKHFGFAVPPLQSAAEAGTRYAALTHALGVRMLSNGDLDFVAPYGLRDLFAMHIRPNRLQPNNATFDAKALACQQRWPEVTIERWAL